MSRVINDRDTVAKTIVPATVSETTDPSEGDAISGATHTVSTSKKAHVLAITVTGSAAGDFFLNINGDNIYPLRVAANGMVRVVFYYRTFVGEAGQEIKVVSGSDLTGDYSVCMEVYEEETSS